MRLLVRSGSVGRPVFARPACTNCTQRHLMQVSARVSFPAEQALLGVVGTAPAAKTSPSAWRLPPSDSKPLLTRLQCKRDCAAPRTLPFLTSLSQPLRPDMNFDSKRRRVATDPSRRHLRDRLKHSDVFEWLRKHSTKILNKDDFL